MGAPDLQRLRAVLQEIERRRARESLAVYAGLQIPAEVENDEDLVGLHKLSLPARYIPAEHHRLLIEKLEAVERGEIKRLMVFMPPGSAKSTYCSVLFPAWYLGRHPTHCVIQGSYNDSLASRFGRRARNTFASSVHRSVFDVGLAKDSKAAGEWETEAGGEYFSFGVNTGVTGRRSDGVLLDDIVKGRKEADSQVVRDSTWETYKADVRTRMKPGAWIVYVATRWHEDDPAGRILPDSALGKTGWFTAKDGEKWYVISLKAVIESDMDAADDPLGREVGEILWPEWFTPAMFETERRIQGPRNWSALYRQMPRPDEGAVLKRQHWRKWPGEKPPKCEYMVSVYDTAFEEGEENDYSARTTWGIFYYEEERESVIKALENKLTHQLEGRHCAILLERYKKKVEFPELRKEAIRHYKDYHPDKVIVEKKASGHSLIQELRRAKVPVMAVKADKSKLARAHAASNVLEDGCVFYMDRPWAREVVDECAAATFIKGSPGNDIPDTCVHAWMWLRRTFHLNLKDEKDDEPPPDDGTKRRYYG